MMCFTLSTSTANWITDRQFRSVWTTTFAMLRWTKSSPGSRLTISLAGTRLSEHPIQRYSGDCWRESFRKKSGSLWRMASAQSRFWVKRWSSCPMTGVRIRVFLQKVQLSLILLADNDLALRTDLGRGEGHARVIPLQAREDGFAPLDPVRGKA